MNITEIPGRASFSWIISEKADIEAFFSLLGSVSSLFSLF
jgi:hypothetical protein